MCRATRAPEDIEESWQLERPDPEPRSRPAEEQRPPEDESTILMGDPTQAGLRGMSTRGDRSRPSAAPPPARIGHFRILGTLGVGGMGTVYEAEQEHPRRRVALKVVRGGRVADQLRLKMFEREVDTLARLKHPNIGALYEAGSTEDGQHFFAMELVRGQTLDAYIRNRHGRLDGDEVRFRLRLFNSICAGVNYAHQRGVIHRDLKPSNIVVSESVDAAGIPEIKILDFGLARMTNTDVEAATAVTEVGMIKGTLAYMSPEQSRGNPDEIDLRSDVYTLGILLFEILTGARPYDTTKTSFVDALRIIGEQTPMSLRQSWPEPGAPDVDLQTISGKALEKEADRRYGSAAALAEDIERYLDSRPILARAPSTLYLMRKFARRNRTLVGGIAATLVVLIAGAAISTMFAFREAAQRRAAVKAQQDLQAVVDFQASMLSDVNPQRMGRRLADDLENRLGAAQEERGTSPDERAAALTAFHNSMNAINTTDAALQVIDTNILEHALTTAQTRFADQPLVRAQLLRSIGGTYLKIGLYDKAEPPLAAARATYDSVLGNDALPTLAAAHHLAMLYAAQGRTEEAEPLLVNALEKQQEALGLRNEEVLGTMNGLAMLYADMDRLAVAESLYALALPEHIALRGEDDPNTLDIMSNFAWALTLDGKYAQAESLGTQTLALRRRVLGNEDSATMGSVNNLGVLYVRMGRLDEAEPLYLEDYETSRRLLGDEHPDILVSMSNLGRLYNARGKFVEAEAILAKALATSERVMPPGFFGTGITMQSYCDALLGLQRYGEAETYLLKAYHILVPVMGEDRPGVQRVIGSLVQVYERTGRPDKAAEWRRHLTTG
jgi:eukaryotic-like serine/threonine-protein kinase